MYCMSRLSSVVGSKCIYQYESLGALGFKEKTMHLRKVYGKTVKVHS